MLGAHVNISPSVRAVVESSEAQRSRRHWRYIAISLIHS